MSDDIPLIFAEDVVRPGAPRRAVFASAMSATQMQQYAAAGWRVLTAAGFEGAAAIDLAEVPAVAAAEAELVDADLISFEAPTWPDAAEARLQRWRPRTVKVNAAFHGRSDAACEAIAETLRRLGYDLVGCHWRDDNSYRLRSVGRIEPLAAFGAPDWKHTNVIATRDRMLRETLLTVARLYVGEERRIAELRLGHAVRGDHIARLEDALMAFQRAPRGAAASK